MRTVRSGPVLSSSGVGSTAGALIVNGVPSMLNATWKFTALKFLSSMTMPLPRMSSSESGFDVTDATSTSLMTRIGMVVAGAPPPVVASRMVSPFLTRRMPSRT